MSWFGPRAEIVSGVKLIQSDHMVDQVEDWSKVRSPSRAKRRRAKHKQNIVVSYVPRKDFFKLPDGTLVAHPITIQALKAKLARDMNQMFEDQMLYGATVIREKENGEQDALSLAKIKIMIDEMKRW